MRGFIKRSVDLAYDNIITRGSNLSQKHRAKATLKSIELLKGKTSSKDIKQSNEYAIDVLGGKEYAPWLYVYSALNSKFVEGWIPENYYSKIVLPKLNGKLSKIAHFDALSKILFHSDQFPDLAYYVNGLFFDIKQGLLKQSVLKDYLFKDTNKIIFKTEDSQGGDGVFVLTEASFSIEKIRQLGNGGFQSYIKQHSFFDRYMSNSVSTIRLTTVIDNAGNAQLKASFIRFAMSNETHVKLNTSVFIPVDLEKGELNEIGYYINSWQPMKEHPETKTPFAKNIIPHFEECKKTVLSLHKKMPYVRCVGWDMIVDVDNQVKIIEWNANHPNIQFNESTQGPCFSDLGWENLWKK